MKIGKIYLIRDSIKKGNGRVSISQLTGQEPLEQERRVDSISVETPDGRFVRIHRTSGIFDSELSKCKVGSVVEWDGTTHFKVRL
jgi:hypothetical protein